MLSASRHLRNFKLAARPPFQTPAVFSVYETDYQILKRDLQRLFPEKFLPENRSYVNVCPFKSGVDCYFNFGQYWALGGLGWGAGTQVASLRLVLGADISRNKRYPINI